MFWRKSYKLQAEEEITELLEDEYQPNYEVDINTLFFVVKYGEEINQKIIKNDTYEYESFLVLRRTLILEGIRIDISEWAEWTLTITLVYEDKELKVAECLIPNEYIKWDRDNNFVENYSKLEWLEQGTWCKDIYERINSLKSLIDNRRKAISQKEDEEEAKQKALEEEERTKKRAYFESIYRKQTK